ncbi:MAG TPA: MaoC family dehydratase N-terminal domain-containing protein [Beijerinckiaceae bacterium]|jgi:3-methylfumaryl-CoA hydratase
MDHDLDHLRTWIGRTEERSDLLTARLAEAFDATLDEPPHTYAAGDEAPLGIHWCIGNPAVRASGLGRDGHPKRQGFMPPVPLPRRMWAAGELAFSAPLVVGAEATRVSTVASLDFKAGRTGPLWFLGIDHDYRQEGLTCVRERQTIVYREDPKPGENSATSGPGEAEPKDAARTLVPDSTMLFRYSALTFNGHRIHYDKDYVRDVEGYPDLVVHGPLIATLLLRAAAGAGPGRLQKLSFRALSPSFVDRPLSISLAQAEGGLAATATSEGRRIMAAHATFAA